MDSLTEHNSEVSPPILPVTDDPASWTTSQGDDGDGDGGIGTLDDDADMQDSDPDTTDNYDPELGDGQDLYVRAPTSHKFCIIDALFANLRGRAMNRATKPFALLLTRFYCYI